MKYFRKIMFLAVLSLFVSACSLSEDADEVTIEQVENTGGGAVDPVESEPPRRD